MHIYDPSKVFVSSVSGERPFNIFWPLYFVYGDSPHGQRLCDGIQDIYITLEVCVEPRCIDQHDSASVNYEFIRILDLLRTRLEICTLTSSGSAREVDKLV